MARYQPLALLMTLMMATTAAAFVSPSKTARSTIVRPTLSLQHKLYASNGSSGNNSGGSSNDDSSFFYNDFEDDLFSSSTSSSAFSLSSSNSNNNSDDIKQPSSAPKSISAATDPSFFESLLKRQAQLQQSSRELLDQWIKGSAKTFAAFTINEAFYKQQEEQALGSGGINTGSSSSSGSFPSNSYSNKEDETEELPFDWVRRVSIGTYPRVVCGSAHGSIYVADVESKKVLGVARNVHSSHHNSKRDLNALDDKMREYLYGDYDGGGVLAVAMSSNNILSSGDRNNNLVASAGREGGVKLFQLVQSQEENVNSFLLGSGESSSSELRCIGEVPSLKRPLPGVRPTPITCLKFDSLGRLFMGGRDGLLRMVTFVGGTNQYDMDVTVISSPKRPFQAEQPSPILSLDICDELDMVATTHVNGNVCVYSTNENVKKNKMNDPLRGVWNPFRDTNNPCHARSVAFVSAGDSSEDDPSWSIVVGGGNGELWMRQIDSSYIPSSADYFHGDEDNDDDDDVVSNDIPTLPSNSMQRRALFKENSMQQIKPSHQGPVLSLATRPGGILVSAGHDGMLRVSQLWPTPKALYGLGGYKVWIGNICIDSEGKRLLSDGRDDVVVVHDFSKEEEEPEM